MTLFSEAVPLPQAVYRDFIDMLFSMGLPVLGLGLVFVGVAGLTAYHLGDAIIGTLAVTGGLVTIGRGLLIRAYNKSRPVVDASRLKQWERYYALGNYAFALLLGMLSARALTYPFPVFHLLTVSLVFSFGAGVVSRISIRPFICAVSLLLATVPTVVALALHALEGHPTPLHSELFLIESLLVAMITALSLQTVAHLYRSAVAHHTARHDMAHLAKRDPLTGLANRLLLRERFQEISTDTIRSGSKLAMHFIDLDGFKAINDTYGHPAGDEILRQVAAQLETMVRADDIVARVGGDEFIVIQKDVFHEDEAEMLARRLIKRLSAPYEVGGISMSISASVGIAIAPDLSLDLEQLISCADSALYRSKMNGKATLHFCTREDALAVKLAVA
ncbi:GGDEF domain-containing protein [Sphingobium sp. JS3065]|uniref:GGDEF domain-containing protein n=1 Tax=Sphingobium sp. JS3065 TaxID=2970925 RepID=UPI0022640EE5|nr:GGDEF domain-containing protein [Sphingobium sp. JS3065]UZW55885.1 GGDEF domain-containing protein [Sphingobium sp. JS3065]